MTTPPRTLEFDTTLDDIVRFFEAHAISAAPVLAAQRLAGIVSTTDVVRFVSRGGGSATAQSLMSTSLLSASPDEPLDEAARRLVAGRVHHLLVLDGERLVGILSASDLFEEILTRRIVSPIATIMTTPVESIDIGDSINEATRRLVAANVHGLVAFDGRNPIGVFTHREAIASRLLPPELRERPVEEVMSYETICLSSETPIFRAAAYGMAMHVRRFLAVDHRAVVGIVSSVDLVGAWARMPAPRG